MMHANAAVNLIMEANFRARALYERFGFAHENALHRDTDFGGEIMPEVRYRMALKHAPN